MPKSPRSIAVFCGSQPGKKTHHMEAAALLGTRMAQDGITLVYGGGKVGLMGAVADAVTQNGGDVIGVIPEFLMKREAGNPNLPTLEVTDSMHSRKRRMFELADAFVTLAGGLGTLDETVEIITWKQLGLHNKPIIILSEDGFWQGFETLVEHIVTEGFAYSGSRELYEIVPSVDVVFEVLKKYDYSAQDTSQPDRL